jgi:hypothetical protein
MTIAEEVPSRVSWWGNGFEQGDCGSIAVRNLLSVVSMGLHPVLWGWEGVRYATAQIGYLLRCRKMTGVEGHSTLGATRWPLMILSCALLTR